MNKPITPGQGALGQLMEAEIREQPEVYRQTIAAAEYVRSVARLVATRQIRFVVLAARGSSDNAARYGKYLVETRLGLPAGLASPSVATVYGAEPAMDDVLLIALSQSGASPDIAAAVETAARRGAVTVAITAVPDSPIAARAHHVLPLHTGVERAVVATKTYTAELLTLFLLIEAMAARNGLEATALPDLAHKILETTNPNVAQVASVLESAACAVVIARGYDYATAHETALKLIEAAALPSTAFSSADLMHGPVTMIQSGLPVIAIAPSGRGGEAMEGPLADLYAGGAKLVIVTDANARRRGKVEETAGVTMDVRMPDEHLWPLLTILPLQLLAMRLGLLRGVDPDRLAGLNKITRTL